MPVPSRKRLYLSRLRRLLVTRLMERASGVHRLLSQELDSNDVEQRDQMEEDIDFSLLVHLERCLEQRYLFRNRFYRVRVPHPFERDLVEPVRGNDDSSDATSEALVQRSQNPWLTDREFIQKYRMPRDAFRQLVSLIRGHEVFQQGERGPSQAPVEHQLMVFLKYIGTEGSGASDSDLRNMFSISRGSVNIYKERVLTAILSLRNMFLTWPTHAERELISESIFDNYGLPNCVGIADGTLFPLAFAPSSEDAPDYSGRKYAFSLTCFIVSDHERRIRYYLNGWPGSAHDDRVFRNSRLFQHPEEYFSVNQYIIGDSAYSNTNFMVSCFRKPVNGVLTHEQENMNDALASPRTISEHTNGILKGRFPWLRSIRIRITRDRGSLLRILRYTDACVILHNMLIDFRLSEMPDTWVEGPSENIESDDDNDNLPNPVPLENPEINDNRRKVLLQFLSNYHMG